MKKEAKKQDNKKQENKQGKKENTQVNSEKDKGITVTKEQDMPTWYEQVCLKAEIADFGPVKGTMVIRPNGYAIWQAIQDYFNANIVKPNNVRNAYFPLFIPESFFKKESEHAQGFSPEVAWLDTSVSGEGERIAIRPTSETIMYDSYSKWIRSYKDLPLKINQWCNVVRWETQATKLFLRSREFLWQEGHCVYETEKECEEDTINYIKLYQKLCKELLALPTMIGQKTEKEKFAGAKATYAIEGFMPDGKALQCGTSHNLGQGFAKAFNISFLGKDEKQHLPWQNSWGLSTRLLGGTIMTHSDNKGLVLPPKAAENKLVIVPIIIAKNQAPLKKAKELAKQLQEFNPIIDEREGYSAGYKFSEWEMRGIPLRIEIGPRDLEENKIVA
ncbi:proline--tRNA ligase, partial [Candidatus Pacearchaeota archaeon]|nr:proline--tRNA ligase [Candidatus Pacearchaeota archaeon]